MKPAAQLRLAAITPFTTIDYPGKLSAVLFVQGCPWRCSYCHNAWMQPRSAPEGTVSPTWSDAEQLFSRRKGLLDAVVFSGGEPCTDPALSDAMRIAREKFHLAVGLHTSGAYPRHLREVLSLVDWVGLDVKANPQNAAQYDAIAGRVGAALNFRDSFAAIRESGIPYEVRTTVHPSWLPTGDILETARYLREKGVENYALQIYRPAPGVLNGYPKVDADYPGVEVEETLSALFPQFVVRRF